MVIQCPACQTKFRIADEKVSAAGVQVRCSKCANTFPVRREDGEQTGEIAAATAPPTGAVTQVTQAPPPFAPTLPASSDPPSMFRAPSRPEMGTERADAGVSAPVAPPPPGFGFGPAGAPNVDLFTGRTAAPLPPPPGFGSGGLPPGMPDPFAAIADGAAPPGGPASGFDPFSAQQEESASPTVDPRLRDSLLKDSPSLEQPDEAHDAPLLTGNASTEFGTNLDFGAAAAEAEKTAAPSRPKPKEERLDIDGERAPERIPRGPRPADFREKQAAKKKPKAAGSHAVAVDAPRDSRQGYRLLLGLFFVGAFTGAWASLTDGSLKPSNLDRARLSVLLGPPAADAAVSGLAMTARSGSYLQTPPGRPRVFVAQGVAVNAGSVARGFLEVRGRLKDGTGEVLTETKVPCGNSFREDTLRAVNAPDELFRLYVPLGDGGSNAKVDPGSAVPCTVVFFNAPLPAKVAEYELEIVAAQPAS